VALRFGAHLGRLHPATSTLVPPVAGWAKPSASYDDFLKDRYQCFLEARTQVSGAVVNPSGGAAGQDKQSQSVVRSFFPVWPQMDEPGRDREARSNLYRQYLRCDNQLPTNRQVVAPSDRPDGWPRRTRSTRREAPMLCTPLGCQ
jgi:hypothetical protein